MTMSFPEIAAAIEARIRAGEWAVGAKIPTTEQFAAEYGVSEASAYRALSFLVLTGWLRGERGRGRFVSEKVAQA